MKKSILSIGKALKKSHQKIVYGGGIPFTHADDPCYDRVSGRRATSGCPCSEGSDFWNLICRLLFILDKQLISMLGLQIDTWRGPKSTTAGTL